MRILPADPAIPLYGPDRTKVDPVQGITVDDFDPFWHRRIRAGEAVIAPVEAAAEPDPTR